MIQCSISLFCLTIALWHMHYSCMSSAASGSHAQSLQHVQRLSWMWSAAMTDAEIDGYNHAIDSAEATAAEAEADVN